MPLALKLRRVVGSIPSSSTVFFSFFSAAEVVGSIPAWSTVFLFSFSLSRSWVRFLVSFYRSLPESPLFDEELVFREDYYRNWEYLTEYFNERDVSVFSFPTPPPKLDDYDSNLEATNKYYSNLISDGILDSADQHLDLKHAMRLEELQTMPSRTLESIWWPFSQHGLIEGPKDVTVIDSAHGDFFDTYSGHMHEEKSTTTQNLMYPLFDGSASWWTQALGHANPALTMAAARAR